MSKFKWCIKRTPENYKEVNEWIFKKRGFFTGHSEFYIHSEKVEGNAFISDRIYPDFHEITLDEFRLLTDPERREKIISLGGTMPGNERWVYTNEGNITISVEVYNELSRLFAESLNDEIPIKDRDMGGIMGLLPNPKFHVDDFKTEAEKEILKRLKKIDKKLTKLIKKQKHQF